MRFVIIIVIRVVIMFLILTPPFFAYEIGRLRFRNVAIAIGRVEFPPLPDRI
jgi:hypothetical protein